MNKEVNLKQALLIFIMILLMVIGCSSIDNTPLSTYTISGTVTGDVLLGVTITLSGGASTTTDKDGKYSFGGLANNKSYTVTPSLTGYAFSPSSSSVNVGGANVTVPTFTAQVLSISGTVTGANGVQNGVTITLSSLAGTQTKTTGTDGHYSFTGPANGLVNGNTYTITPSLTGYVFTPLNWQGTVNGANTADFSMTVPYAQTDLTGTWILHSLTTSSTIANNKWQYATAAVDSSGNVTFSSCGDSTPSTTCPAGTTTWTFDHSSAVIIQSGDSTVNMTMTSNKNFIAGTSGAGTSPSLIIAQKVGASYSSDSSDVQNISSFVFHELSAGNSNEWGYGAGSTDGSGAVTMSSETGPFGVVTPRIGVIIYSSNGVVTMSGGGMDSFNGFLSDDKKTIVGTYTYTDGSVINYKLMIIQITAPTTFTAGPLPAGASVGHLLAWGYYKAWNYFPFTVDSIGTITINNVVSSSSSAKYGTGGLTEMSASGAVTWTDGTTPSQGQLSDDGKFIVAIFTTPSTPPTYGLFVLTK